MASTWGLSWADSWGLSWYREPTPPTPPSSDVYGGGGGNVEYVDFKTRYKPKKAIRNLIESAYKVTKVTPKQKEQIIVKVAQEIQLTPTKEIDIKLVIDLINLYELKLIKQRNDELAAIILLLD